MTRHLLRLLLLLVVGTVATGAAARTFTWAASTDALTMDPHATNNSFTAAFVSNVYETLVRFGDSLRIEPALAESWAVLGPTTWRFQLRRGVRFHDGEPLTADDVTFSWLRIQSPGALVRGTLGGIRDVRKVDSHTVDIETHGPFPLLLNALVSGASSTTPRRRPTCSSGARPTPVCRRTAPAPSCSSPARSIRGPSCEPTPTGGTSRSTT
jgi:peptide/nickel transport system substrate-binding protein